jgi:hypothetical protein
MGFPYEDMIWNGGPQAPVRSVLLGSHTMRVGRWFHRLGSVGQWGTARQPRDSARSAVDARHRRRRSSGRCAGSSRRRDQILATSWLAVMAAPGEPLTIGATNGTNEPTNGTKSTSVMIRCLRAFRITQSLSLALRSNPPIASTSDAAGCERRPGCRRTSSPDRCCNRPVEHRTALPRRNR